MHKFVSWNFCQVHNNIWETFIHKKKKHYELPTFSHLLFRTHFWDKTATSLQVYLLCTVDFAVLSTYNEVRFASEGLPDFRDFHRKINISYDKIKFHSF